MKSMIPVVGFGLGMLWFPQVGILSANEYMVRVALPVQGPNIEIVGSQFSVWDEETQEPLLDELKGKLTVAIQGRVLAIQGIEPKPPRVRIRGDGPLRIGHHTLVGEIEIRVGASRRLQAINHLPLERYLVGLLAEEMGVDWPQEALKAQAVASRTFSVHRCLKRQREAYDLSTDTLDQVYRGILNEAEQTESAVKATHGEVLTYGSIPVEALFHACCGGQTRSAKEVFGTAVDYLVQIRDPYCSGCPSENWTVEISIADMENLLNHSRELNWFGTIASMQQVVEEGQPVQNEFSSNHGQKLSFSNQKLRELLGVERVWSSLFSWRPNSTELLFQGHGRGHGVGLCQWGARGMAKRGKGYQEILQFYYPRTELRKMY